MKTVTITFIFALVSAVSLAGTIVPTCNRAQVAKYEAPTGALEHAFVPMSFGKSKTGAAENTKLPANAEIIAVDIVYTDFPKGQSFDVLNEKRAQTTLKNYPGLTGNTAVQWNLVAQTACETKEEAEALFHGVVIHYRVPPTVESVAKEISFLKTIGKPTAKPAVKKDFATAMGGSTAIPPRSKETSKSKTAVLKEGSESYAIVDDSKGEIYLSCYSAGLVGSPFINSSGPDSTVSAVFNRNKWKDMNIAADVTGSMSPYTAQLLLWLSLNFNDKKVKQVTFFNDGDRKREHEKKVGQIGGIYQTATCDIESVRKVATKAMMGGGGGDCPENNLEGVLKAVQANPNCKEVVMIADALAPVKDIALLDQIKVPVRIVLCGTYYGIQSDYLKIAMKTGGSVHTMEADLVNLTTLKEGETITFGKFMYRITSGTFVLVSKA